MALPNAAMAKKQILSASEVDYPPFCIVDAGGQANGFSVELMRAALAAMNHEVVFRTAPWAEVRGWLEQGEIQALPLVGRTLERESIFDFTFPYMSLYGAIVVRKDNTAIHNMDDLRGCRVAVMQGDNAEEFLRRQDRGIEIHPLNTFEEALQELSMGRYDAVVIQRLVALRLIQETGLTNLQIIDRPIDGFRQEFCFAVKEGDRETLVLLNEGLAVVMADGTYRYLHAKWFAALQLPSQGRIIVGGDSNYPPYEYLDENGRPAGYNVDLTRAIAREVGIDVEFRLGPWKEIREDMARGDIDVLQGMLYSTERDVMFDFTQAHTVNHYIAVVRKGEGIIPTTVDDLSQMRIAVQQGDIMHDFALKNGFGGHIDAVIAQEDALRKVVEGKDDCALVSRLTALYWIKQHGWTTLEVGKKPFLSPEYCYAVRNHQKALLAQFSEGLNILEETGEYRRIHDKWQGVYTERSDSIIQALRYFAMILVPLCLILLAVFFWSWSLRRQVADRTMALKKSKETIAASEHQLKKAQAIGKLGSWQIDFNTGKIFNSEESYKIYGLDKEKEYSVQQIQKIPLPEYRQMLDDTLDHLIKGEGRYDVEFKIKRPNDGRILDISSVAEYDPQTNVVTGIIQDVTLRKQSEQALRDSESRFRLLADTAPVGIVILDSKQKTIYVSQQFVKMYGYTIDDFPTVEEWWPLAYPDEVFRSQVRERWNAAVEFAVQTHSEIEPMEFPVRCKDGSVRYTEFRMASTGELMFVILTDISERHKIESQLRQALKMEAVGRLAGGVAHDYNNMLSVIIGYAELAMDKVGPETPVHADLKEIFNAARRSAEITRQLLAFARKQTISPRVMDLNETVESMLKMLRRLIGEDIDLAWQAGARVWPVNMDPAQVDQILANLCVNARDAIAGLGKVTIETDNVIFDEAYCADHSDFIPGEFVLLAVSDNGCGMDKETRDNLFEPFFTTKDVNEGTGLGMSTVYGIVKQNNGFINVYSEPEKGTTFKLYLPRYAGEVKEKRAEIPVEIPSGQGETVLLVEDEAQIMKMGKMMLERLGYRVLAANTPSEALRLSEKHAGEIHLLITDVVMPEMNGRDLAGQIRTRCPDIKILFMSGYTANVIAHHGILDNEVNFIQKPFGKKDLAFKVREVLS